MAYRDPDYACEHVSQGAMSNVGQIWNARFTISSNSFHSAAFIRQLLIISDRGIETRLNSRSRYHSALPVETSICRETCGSRLSLSVHK
jgi:hypothetical protein